MHPAISDAVLERDTAVQPARQRRSVVSRNRLLAAVGTWSWWPAGPGWA